jgi:hypothetical protein
MLMTIAISEVLAHRASQANPDRTKPVDLAGSVSAEARKNKNRNKADKKARKRCKRQAEQCTEFFIDLCDGEPECLQRSACCESAGNCDIAAFFDCLIFPG